MPSIIMTLIGEDRPGLVESLARIVAAHRANWLESRMAHLAGQFAGILQVDVAAEQTDQLVKSLRELDQQGLTVIVQTDSADEPRVDTFVPVRLDVVGNDRPGIVQEIAQMLVELNVNVEEIETHCKTAPMSGGNIFHATAQLHLPTGLTLEELRHRLEQIAGDLMVDIGDQTKR